MTPVSASHKYRVIEQFITEEERRSILAWIYDQHTHGHLAVNGHGPGRFYGSTIHHVDARTAPECYRAMRARICAALDLTEDRLAQPLGDYISLNLPGAFIHPHKDDTAPRGSYHLRANIMLLRPEGGGLPIIDGETVDIHERGLWAFRASQYTHWTEPVTGEKHRSVCSFGFFLKEAA